MSLMEQFDKKIPDYYPTMYLDGYTPAQIMHSAKRGMYQKHMERKQLRTTEMDVRPVVEAAMKDVFKGLK